MPTVLVTGASRGLGLELTRHYARAGWRVIATCRDPARAVALRAEAGGSNGLIDVHALDVADAGAVQHLAAATTDPVDVLFNNADVYGERDYQLATVDETMWLNVMRTNLVAPLRLAACFLDRVAASDRKVMAFVSSRMGSIAESTGGSYVYRSSKAALNAGVKALAVDQKARGVIPVVLHPGWVRTAMGGAGADIDVATSIAGMTAVIERLTPGDAGRFFNYTGDPIAW